MQKACLTVEENTRLKSRLQAAEAEAEQRQATSAEQDYEEVIQLLEAEIRDLKNQLAAKRQACGAGAKVSPNTRCTVPYCWEEGEKPADSQKCLINKGEKVTKKYRIEKITPDDKIKKTFFFLEI